MRRVVYLSFKRTTFDEIWAAAKQTGQAISFYLRDVIESDIASRRPPGGERPKAGWEVRSLTPAELLRGSPVGAGLAKIAFGMQTAQEPVA